MGNVKEFEQLEIDVKNTFLRAVGEDIILPDWFGEYGGQTLTILQAGRPKTNPKTDVYVGLGKNDNVLTYLGISIKKDNADWVENWAKASTLSILFGSEQKAAAIVQDCINYVGLEKLEENVKRFSTSKGLPGIGIGYTLQLGFKSKTKEYGGGNLDDLPSFANMHNFTINEAYSGARKYADTKISMGEGMDDIVVGGGVANCMLHAALGSWKNVQEIVNMLSPIPCSGVNKEEDEKEKLYFTFKKKNYYQKAKESNLSSECVVLIKWEFDEQLLRLTPRAIGGNPTIGTFRDAVADFENVLEQMPENYNTIEKLYDYGDKIFI